MGCAYKHIGRFLLAIQPLPPINRTGTVNGLKFQCASRRWQCIISGLVFAHTYAKATYAHTYAHTHAHAYAHSYAHYSRCVQLHAYTHMRIHEHIRIQMYTYRVALIAGSPETQSHRLSILILTSACYLVCVVVVVAILLT